MTLKPDSCFMWVITDTPSMITRQVKAYPSGTVLIYKKRFPDEVILSCRRICPNILWYDGSEGSPRTDYYIVTEDGELKGVLYCDTPLWLADFAEGGEHERKYKEVYVRWRDKKTGQYKSEFERLRLGFSRW